jgi:hypothetical protein
MIIKNKFTPHHYQKYKRVVAMEGWVARGHHLMKNLTRPVHRYLHAVYTEVFITQYSREVVVVAVARSILVYV